MTNSSIVLMYRRPLYLALGLAIFGEFLIFIVFAVLLFPSGSMIEKALWLLICGVAIGATTGTFVDLFRGRSAARRLGGSRVRGDHDGRRRRVYRGLPVHGKAPPAVRSSLKSDSVSSERFGHVSCGWARLWLASLYGTWTASAREDSTVTGAGSWEGLTNKERRLLVIFESSRRVVRTTAEGRAGRPAYTLTWT